MQRQVVVKDGPLRGSPSVAVEVDGDGWPLEVVWRVGFDDTDSYLYRLVTPVEPGGPPVYEFVMALGAKERGT
jgi:hypothetical protein